jgi:hypothetical protein
VAFCEHIVRSVADFFFRVSIIHNDLATGKTSLIQRYTKGVFNGSRYQATLGVDFSLKELHLDANTIVNLQLWDVYDKKLSIRESTKNEMIVSIAFEMHRVCSFLCHIAPTTTMC